MKTIFPKYYEDSLHEIEINKIIHNPVNGKYVIRMIDNFVSKKEKEMCIITELLGTTLNDLFEEQNEDFESISDEENLSCEEDESEEYDRGNGRNR